MGSQWARVHVIEHLFGVLDRGEIPIRTVDWSNGLLGVMPIGLMVHCGISMGYVHVRAIADTTPPDLLDVAEWDEVVEVSVHAQHGELRVDSLEKGPVAETPLLSPYGPGWYRLRGYARGRDTAYDALLEDPVEEYLISTWPSASIEPATIVRTSDQAGEALRMQASTLTTSQVVPPKLSPEEVRQQELRRSLLASRGNSSATGSPGQKPRRRP